MTSNGENPRDIAVLIIGAGPTGLVLAMWLTKLGIRVRIIDRLAEAGTTSRALAVQARTLEFYQQIGLAQAVVEAGHKVAAANLWVRGAQAARIPLEAIGQGLTPFPHLIVFPQDEHERLLIDRLDTLGVRVERCVELAAFRDTGAQILATLRNADGTEETCAADYIAGCDGARSKVREVLDVGFPGGTYDHLFYVADVEAGGPPMNGELHVDLDDVDFLAVFPLRQPGHARLVGTVRDSAAPDDEHLRFEDVQDHAIHNLKVDVKRVNWFSTYRVHHRVAQSFRKGRAFLLGDAAHIHSPVGGQGMNTGIGDAVNLAWKLASAVQHPATAALLDSYEPERIAFAQRLVATTDRAFTGVISPTALARFVRMEAVPGLLPGLFRLPLARRFAFRTVSQIAVNYRGGPLSTGKAGRVSGGDRLPWTGTNYTPLTSLDWQLHLYGKPSPDIEELSAARAVPLQVFAWNAETERAGFAQDAVYLVRPDGYVAAASAGISRGCRNVRLSKFVEDRAMIKVEPITLEGHGVRLEPMTPEHHDALVAAASDGSLWELWFTTVPARHEMHAYIETAQAGQRAGHMLPWVVRDLTSGIVVGSTRYHDIVAAIDRVEIGYTWYSKSRQRTHINTTSKLLLLQHAFESLGCKVIGWRTDNYNFKSQRAIEALGAKRDGILRHHQPRRDGTVRDTYAYSLLATEWPDAKRHLQTRLARHGNPT